MFDEQFFSSLCFRKTKGKKGFSVKGLTKFLWVMKKLVHITLTVAFAIGIVFHLLVVSGILPATLRFCTATQCHYVDLYIFDIACLAVNVFFFFVFFSSLREKEGQEAME